MNKTGRVSIEYTTVPVEGEDVEWWEDNYGNMWHAASFTKTDAMKASKSLEDCSGCEDCENCKQCTDCQRCTDCIRCNKCSDCIDCRYCTNIQDCKECSTCCDIHEQVGSIQRIGMEDEELYE